MKKGNVRHHCSAASGVLIVFMMVGGLALLYGYWVQQLGWMQESAQLRVQLWQQVCYMRAVRLRVAAWLQEHYAAVRRQLAQSVDPVVIPWPKSTEWPDTQMVVVASLCTMVDGQEGVSLRIVCYQGAERRLICSSRCVCYFMQHKNASVFFMTHAADI